MLIEIDEEHCDKVIIGGLSRSLESMEMDLESLKEGCSNIYIFSTNVEEDIEHTKEFIAAIKLLLNYYGG